ncbi:hypothetical protein, partial [Actinocorallia lasiicapitis]
LRVVPGPGGKGTRIVGRGIAQVVRLDNGFLRTLTGGLPRVVASLERAPDGTIRFADLVLTSPLLTLRGSGYRRNDETFHIDATGRHSRYGPVTLLRLDGKIDRPPTGFNVQAQGGSRLGPFTGMGRILLLPPGVDDVLFVDRLAVSGTVASGRLAMPPGGFEGTLTVAGGGLSGALRFHPV